MTNGEPILVRGVMKPIPTLYKPLMSVDIETHEPYKATVERSDPTALPAAGVVMESVVDVYKRQVVGRELGCGSWKFRSGHRIER